MNSGNNGVRQYTLKGNISYIFNHTNMLVALVALAEEAAELSQAALKLARAQKLIKHPTPVGTMEALDSLNEEYADVVLCAMILNLYADSNLINRKAERWAERLEEVENNAE